LPLLIPSLCRPKNCKQAIDKGLELFQAKKFQEAIDMFNVALELPGNGAYRLAGSVREFRHVQGCITQPLHLKAPRQQMGCQPYLPQCPSVVVMIVVSC